MNDENMEDVEDRKSTAGACEVGKGPRKVLLSQVCGQGWPPCPGWEYCFLSNYYQLC
jgi:hypothetical protein